MNIYTFTLTHTLQLPNILVNHNPFTLDNGSTSTNSASTGGTAMPSSSAPSSPKEVIVKIDGKDSSKEPTKTSENTSTTTNAGRMLRDSSYDLSNDAVMSAAANTKDFGFVTEPPLSRIAESVNTNYGQRIPREVRVPFNDNTAETAAVRGSKRSSNAELEEVLVCSSNSSFRRNSSLLRTKTKSRLFDPPENNKKSYNQRTAKSLFLGKGSEIDEDDPFRDEDLPEDYKKMKFSALSILQLLSLVLIIAALVCILTIDMLKNKEIFNLQLWKWELMILVLIFGRLVSGWGIRILVFFFERNFLLRKRVLYFIYGLRNAVQNCIWLALVLIAWQWIFDKKVVRLMHGKVLPYVTKIWVCLLVGTLIWLVKTLLVKVLASSFQVSTFFERILESLFHQYVIETLSGPPLIEIQHEQAEEKVIAEVQKLQRAGVDIRANLKASVFPKTGKVFGKSPMATGAKSHVFSGITSKTEDEGGITIDHLHRLNQKNISARNMKRLINIVRKGVLSTLSEQIEGSTDEDESAVQITSEKQAKAAAKKIFYNVVNPGSEFIYLEDLMRFMREDEALKTTRLFEGANENKGISKRALKIWVVNAYRERRALALSLNDTKTAVNKLHQILNALVGLVIIIIWLLILKVATTHFFIFLSSQLILVVFVFGNTCKTTFEAIIFLFVMHPFDVGDRVEIDEVQMVVEEMNILTTVFLRFDNQKIYYPNSVLSTKFIGNYYRSPDMGDAIDFVIHISTPGEKIATMKERITRYVGSRSDHWYPAPLIVMRDVEDMNTLKWSVWLSHTINHQDMGERWTRRALLVEEMVKIFCELDIECRLLPHDVNVRKMPPLTSTRLPSTWTICAP
ncbi:unnamed protein product [Fraxinus pennsylvanica]|uniref:Mechanosensitive ion channel protein n=1 Tax=Fraxinus pennsylvanica TaxID=56036 RepID=A0AAD1Z0D5_9LAMI|nr:unnamed protein product [Fraxinus pennsylvanica]